MVEWSCEPAGPSKWDVTAVTSEGKLMSRLELGPMFPTWTEPQKAHFLAYELAVLVNCMREELGEIDETPLTKTLFGETSPW